MWTEVKTCSQLDISWAQKRVPSCFLQLASSATRKQLHTCELNTQRFLRKFHCIVVQKIEQLQKLRCCNDTPDYASWQNSHSQIDHIDYEFTACTSKSILGPILAPFKRHFSHFKFVLKVYLGGLFKKNLLQVHFQTISCLFKGHCPFLSLIQEHWFSLFSV